MLWSIKKVIHAPNSIKLPNPTIEEETEVSGTLFLEQNTIAIKSTNPSI